ncbi:MAG: NADH-quinone oxidoreductase subunit C [Saprospiraceae bacterium]|nr:NADH-quinone oxidoreductase subunit C [Saprospiraceae bacterium]
MTTVVSKDLQLKLNEAIGLSCEISEDAFGVLNMELPVNQIFGVVLFLYRDEEFGFNFLTDICGVHYPQLKGRELCVVYHLQSMQRRCRLRIKVYVPLEKPEIPTLCGIYGSANWMERETYDFYGIQFVGHPNLRRILNMDEMTEFPMRKEFPLEDPNREDKMDYQFGR